jgi:hypothetical protein
LGLVGEPPGGEEWIEEMESSFAMKRLEEKQIRRQWGT